MGLFPLSLSLPLDYRVMIFTAGISLVTGATFGMIPALRASRTAPAEVLKNGTRRGRFSRGPQARWALVATQISLSFLMIVAAGLFVRSLQNLARQDLGFQHEGVLQISLGPKGNGYVEPGLADYYVELLRQTKALSGVRAASLIHPPPLADVSMMAAISIDGYEPRPGEDQSVLIHYSAPGVFETLQTRLVQGRDFSFNDVQNSPKVGLINETMARRFYPHGDAVGNHFILTTAPIRDPIEIVGVVADSKYRNLKERASPAIYLSSFQHPLHMLYPTLLVRTRGNPSRIVQPIRRLLDSLGKEKPAVVLTLSEYIDGLLAQDRLIAALASFFGLLGLVLACLGLYGMTAYVVSSRFREIGIRMALGATRIDVRRMVFREVLLLIITGLALGLGISLAITRLASDLFYGLTATDPVILGTTAGLIAGVGLLSALLPVLRATRIEPAVVLRDE